MLSGRYLQSQLSSARTLEELKAIVENLCTAIGEIQDQLERLNRAVSDAESKTSQTPRTVRR